VERVVKGIETEGETAESILEGNTTGEALKTGSHGSPMIFRHPLLQKHQLEKQRGTKNKR
jgi:hypothetical protein